MKVYDPQGEYTPEEVKAALTGEDNSRRISQRYERLDQSNNYIEDIDYIQKCTIENNSFADIKRTAKFDMYDAGEFNFLQDRIKPYLRIEMPEDENYGEKMRTLSPAIWYRLDEPARTDVVNTSYDLGTSYASQYSLSNAQPMTLRAAGSDTLTATFSSTGRSDLAARAQNTTTDPFTVSFKSLLNVPDPAVNQTYKVYFGTLADGSDATVVASGSFNLALNNTAETVIEKPELGYYFVTQHHTYTPSYKPSVRTSVSLAHMTTMSDASENRVHGRTKDYAFGGTGLINNTSMSFSSGDSGNFYTVGSMPDVPTETEWRSPYRSGKVIPSPQYTVASKFSAAAGEQYYIEFDAGNSTNLDVGLYLTNSSGGSGSPVWESTQVVRAGAIEMYGPDYRWARFGATITIDPSWTSVAFAQLTFVGGAWVDETTIKVVRRASTNISGGVINRSLMPSVGKPQTWETPGASSIPLKESISVNYWQKLGVAKGAFANTSRFTTQDAVIEFTSAHTPGSDAVFTAKVTPTGIYNTTSYSGTLSVREAIFTASTQMITYRMDPTKNRVGIYADASLLGWMTKVGGSAELSEVAWAFSEPSVITKTYVSFSTTAGTNLIDDYTVHTRALPVYEIQELVVLGQNSRPKRRGYVEWPQGVFVLSAPSRTLTDGNGVMRGVEAYDQLLVLSEDAVSDRYAIAAGVKYTDAIDSVLASVKAVRELDLTSDIWASSYGAKADTSDMLTLAPNTTFSVKPNKMGIEGASFSAKVPSTAQHFNLGILSKYVWSRGSDNTITALDIVASTGSSFTYNSVTHAYLRVRESGGRVYWEYSSNGVNWTTYISVDAPRTPVTIGIYVTSNSTVTSTFTRVRAAGSLNMTRNMTTSSATLPNVREWEPGTSKLRIINDLLSAINYGSATYDENGVFVAEPYVSPTLRPSEYTYATDSSSVITGDVNQTIDLFNVPNSWVLVVSEPDMPPMVAKYVNSDPNSVTSTVSRGRTIVDIRTENEAASQAVLDAKVLRLATEASQIYEHIEFKTGIMPIHQDSDVFTLVIDGMVINDKYSETAWSMELSNGATMTHRVRRSVAL